MDRLHSEEKILNTESAPFKDPPASQRNDINQVIAPNAIVIDLEANKVPGKEIEMEMLNKKNEETKKPMEQTNVDYDEHKLSIQEVANRYGTSVDINNVLNSQGLTNAKVDELRLIHGYNTMKPVKGENPFVLFLRKLVQLFHVLLIISGSFCFVLYGIFPNDEGASDNIYLGAILLFVTVFNTYLDFYQEYKSAQILKSFMKLVPTNAVVVRNGMKKEIPTAEILPGDLIALSNGDKVPADIRIAYINGELKVDNSSLTGESEPVEVFLDKLSDEPMRAHNLLFNGTIIAAGEGMGIVIRIGDDTALGKLAKLTTSEKVKISQLQHEIDTFVKNLAFLSILTACTMFGIGLGLGYKLNETFAFFVGVFISFVPQGLPTKITVLLTIGAKRMAEKNVLVKDLNAIETLGSITFLASDKTGTLTQNKMTVVGCWLNLQKYEFDGNKAKLPDLVIHENEQENLKNTELSPSKHSTPNFDRILEIATLCSKAYFEPEDMKLPMKERRIKADATESALFRFASMKLGEPDGLRTMYPKVCEIPFNSENKWMLTIHAYAHSRGSYRIFIKGAPEKVWKLCKFIRVNEKDKDINESMIRKFDRAYKKFASNGQRVLGFAELQLAAQLFPEGFKFDRVPQPNFPIEAFTFLGFMTLHDPPKEGVDKAVSELRRAGIRVAMVTGDHPITAEAIARKIGIITGTTKQEVALRENKDISKVEEFEYDAAVTEGGENLDKLTDEEWDKILCKEELVFARTLPHQKLKIVQKAQEKGHVVGVTGDGVNDAPAIKKGNLGISMNKTGSDVTKEAAAMILLDDNFATIVNGVREGRLVFQNLKKTIRYTLSHILPELYPYFIFIICGAPIILSPFMILVTDLCNEIPPGISYAWELPEKDLLEFPPRKALTTEKKMVHPELYDTNDASWWRKLYLKLRHSLTGGEHTGETLVDRQMLVLAYANAGTFIAMGAWAGTVLTLYYYNVDFTSFFKDGYQKFWQPGAPSLKSTTGKTLTETDQINILASANSAYFIGIMMGQWFNLFMVKNSYTYMSRRQFKNPYCYYAMIFDLFVAVLVVYAPSSHVIFKNNDAIWVAWIVPLCAGVLYVFAEYFRIFLTLRGHFGGVPRPAQVPRLLKMKSNIYDPKLKSQFNSSVVDNSRQTSNNIKGQDLRMKSGLSVVSEAANVTLPKKQSFRNNKPA